MSFLLAAPQELADAASDLAGVGSTLSTANAAASAPTTGLLPAAADEVSTQIATLFSAHGQGFQRLSAQAAAFHEQFVQALTASANTYATAEANAVQTLLNAVNAPVQAVLGHPLIGSAAAAPDARRWRRAHWSSRPQRAAAGAHRWGQWRRQRRPAAQVVVEHDQRRGSTCGIQLDCHHDREQLPRDRALRAVRLRAGRVRGGFCALGWHLAPQINFLYNLFEPIVQSGLFNILDWLSGIDHLQPRAEQLLCGHPSSINFFIQTEINWLLGFLPPLPPLPPSPVTGRQP